MKITGDKIKKINKAVFSEISKIEDLNKLEELRIKYLGRKGELTEILKSIKDFTIDEKRQTGPVVQKLKIEFEKLINNKKKELKAQGEDYSFGDFDPTKPGKKIKIGNLHPLSKVDEEIRQIFTSMNFSVIEGPEIESEYYNFDALNIPADHPARDVWDTFWIKNPENSKLRMKNEELKNRDSKSTKAKRLLLRTHTSPVQIRYMEKNNPPFQVISSGRVFRYEATDSSHEINFHQVEGLMVGKDISLANFKFVIEEFFKRFFKGQKIDFRFRPSYFPFVEPGVEVDIKFKNKWLEVMGAGMVHRNVFKSAGYNPDEWRGFAFGMSPERLSMIKYNIPDIRLFYSGDLRFIEQF